MLIPVMWSFRRKNIMPIVEVKGESQVEIGEFFMIHQAVEIIEKARVFKGIPCQDPPSQPNEVKLTVYFSLIFPSEKELASFMEDINNME